MGNLGIHPSRNKSFQERAETAAGNLASKMERWNIGEGRLGISNDKDAVKLEERIFAKVKDDEERENLKISAAVTEALSRLRAGTSRKIKRNENSEREGSSSNVTKHARSLGRE